jgi:predicted amidohydrolase YtcJ
MSTSTGDPAPAWSSSNGLTLVPGFIDAHQHRIGDAPARLGRNLAAILQEALAQGLTSIHELYVDEPRLLELRDLDESGRLGLRVNAYLPVNENSPQGRPLGDWYRARQATRFVSAKVRVSGAKVFTDFDDARVLLWKQPDLNAFLLARHREGWQLAIKTVSSESLGMILAALQSVRAAEPGITSARVRLEHMLFATPGQIATIRELGVVPAINTNAPGSLIGVPGIAELIGRNPPGSFVPWRSLFDAGIPAAGISGYPSLWVDEPTGAPFGSPLHLIYQAVTRDGNHGVPSPPELLGQALTAEQALRAHTINAARAAFEEGRLGSIAPGKLADLVVLSDDPLRVAPRAINDVRVLLTVVGGDVLYCADGSGLC